MPFLSPGQILVGASLWGPVGHASCFKGTINASSSWQVSPHLLASPYLTDTNPGDILIQSANRAHPR